MIVLALALMSRLTLIGSVGALDDRVAKELETAPAPDGAASRSDAAAGTATLVETQERLLLVKSLVGGSPERLFAACLRESGQRGWKVHYTDPTTKTLSFVAAGRKLRIGGGMEMSVLVAENRRWHVAGL